MVWKYSAAGIDRYHNILAGRVGSNARDARDLSHFFLYHSFAVAACR